MVIMVITDGRGVALIYALEKFFRLFAANGFEISNTAVLPLLAAPRSAASSAAAHGPEHRRAPERRGQQGRFSLVSFFGEAKKETAPPGAHPGKAQLEAQEVIRLTRFFESSVVRDPLVLQESANLRVARSR